jgi:hypothetical protein
MFKISTQTCPTWLRCDQLYLTLLHSIPIDKLERWWCLSDAFLNWSIWDIKNSGYLIQSNYGTKGNFEVVVPVEGGKLQRCYRDNDSERNDWIQIVEFARGIAAASLIQSNPKEN